MTQAANHIKATWPALTARYIRDTGEVRVTVRTTDRQHAEDVAYYTNDADDAIKTAAHMQNYFV